MSVQLGGDKPSRTAGEDVLSLRRQDVLPPLPLDEQVMFANGDRLPGQVIKLAGERLRFRAFLDEGEDLDVPLSALAVVWLGARTVKTAPVCCAACWPSNAAATRSCSATGM